MIQINSAERLTKSENDNIELSPTTNNYIRVKEMLVDHYILPNSSMEYSFLIPSYVGFGGLFDTEEEARNDAMQRLNDTLGEFISASEINVTSSGLKGVPSQNRKIRRSLFSFYFQKQ